ncbi:MAG: LacI family transcriptional regulator [Propionibacteriaceae bacterium]|nr:LacI family transcriptional regulator [Propionibacteriaceae bacterium]
MTAAPTLKDVAERAGVSQATASRVLNGSARHVGDAYQERVHQAAADLGYSVNLSAQATARGTSSLIALLVADIADPYFGEIAHGVARGAEEAGLAVAVAETDRDPDKEAKLVRMFRGLRPFGLILAASRGADPAPELDQELAQFAAGGGQVVALGPGAGGYRAIHIDHLGGAIKLGRTLAGRGYRRAVLLAAPVGALSSDHRVAGFTQGFTEGGGVIAGLYRGGYTREDGYRLMAQLLVDGVAPGTLVVGVSDQVAVGALAALREAGREAGADIALAGFGDTSTGRDVTPALTTVHVPLGDLGYQAVRRAVDPGWAPDAPLDLAVVVRDSTPAVPAAPPAEGGPT